MTTPLAPEALRRICPLESLPFQSTEDLETLEEIVAQDRAVQAITFGIGIKSAGFNLFALGSPGTGKATAVRRFLAREAVKLPTPPDWCYVNNFTDPHRPRAIRLQPGRARVFKSDCERLTEDFKTGIPRAFETEAYEQQKNAVTQAAEKEQGKELEGLKERVEARGFALAKTPSGVVAVPVLRGKPLARLGYSGFIRRVLRRRRLRKPAGHQATARSGAGAAGSCGWRGGGRSSGRRASRRRRSSTRCRHSARAGSRSAGPRR